MMVDYNIIGASNQRTSAIGADGAKIDSQTVTMIRFIEGY